MTRPEWDAEWEACFKRLRAKGYDLVKAQVKARDITTALRGPRPAGSPLWVKLACKLVGRKLAGMKPGQENTMTQRLVAALIYGLTAALSALGAAGIPQSSQGWMAILGVFITAFWGKFSSNTTIVAANRAEWTPEERAAANGGAP